MLLPGNFRRMLATDIDTATASAAAAGGAEKRAYVQRIFSEIAPKYDLLNHLLSFNIDKRWRRRAIARLGLEGNPSGTYLDLCAGTAIGHHDRTQVSWDLGGFGHASIVRGDGAHRRDVHELHIPVSWLAT